VSAAPTITLTREGRAELRFPYDAAFIEQLKAVVPAHARTYDPTVKSWTVMPAYVDVAARLMFATFSDVEVAGPARGRSSAADRAPRAGDPYVVLHLRETAPPELIVAAHKCLARLHHPDKGGSHEAMLAINAAAEALKGGTA
jgi:hypothetical protein